MARKLNKRAFEHAKNLILKGECIQDEKDKWSEHQPSAEKENKFIEKNHKETPGYFSHCRLDLLLSVVLQPLFDKIIALSISISLRSRWFINFIMPFGNSVIEIKFFP
jgi:hypothetical protein